MQLERITIEPGKRGGKPCIRGLRITVADILGWLAEGMTEQEILDDYPELESRGYPRGPHFCCAQGTERRRNSRDMKLLLDENLSRKLVPFLQDRFPGQMQLHGITRGVRSRNTRHPVHSELVEPRPSTGSGRTAVNQTFLINRPAVA